MQLIILRNLVLEHCYPASPNDYNFSQQKQIVSGSPMLYTESEILVFPVGGLLLFFIIHFNQ